MAVLWTENDVFPLQLVFSSSILSNLKLFPCSLELHCIPSNAAYAYEQPLLSVQGNVKSPISCHCREF